MKTKLWLCLAVWAVGLAAADAQPYSMNWFTIDGGGGTSQGGSYSINGTIGQADAGVMSGGAYSLTGGFWSMAVAVATPGAPLLTIAPAAVPGWIRISWPLPATGFILEQCASLSGTILWVPIAVPYMTDGTDRYVEVPAPSARKFYRLHKP